MTQKTKIIIALIIIVLFGIYYSVFQKSVPIKSVDTIPSGIACTMDAKMCPDGTYVGRSGPKCEFVCPTGPVTK